MSVGCIYRRLGNKTQFAGDRVDTRLLVEQQSMIVKVDL